MVYLADIWAPMLESYAEIAQRKRNSEIDVEEEVRQVVAAQLTDESPGAKRLTEFAGNGLRSHTEEMLVRAGKTVVENHDAFKIAFTEDRDLKCGFSGLEAVARESGVFAKISDGTPLITLEIDSVPVSDGDYIILNETTELNRSMKRPELFEVGGVFQLHRLWREIHVIDASEMTIDADPETVRNRVIDAQKSQPSGKGFDKTMFGAWPGYLYCTVPASLKESQPSEMGSPNALGLFTSTGIFGWNYQDAPILATDPRLSLMDAVNDTYSGVAYQAVINPMKLVGYHQEGSLSQIQMEQVRGGSTRFHLDHIRAQVYGGIPYDAVDHVRVLSLQPHILMGKRHVQQRNRRVVSL